MTAFILASASQSEFLLGDAYLSHHASAIVVGRLKANICVLWSMFGGTGNVDVKSWLIPVRYESWILVALHISIEG